MGVSVIFCDKSLVSYILYICQKDQLQSLEAVVKEQELSKKLLEVENRQLRGQQENDKYEKLTQLRYVDNKYEKLTQLMYEGCSGSLRTFAIIKIVIGIDKLEKHH